MRRSKILLVDAAISLVLGIFLVAFPKPLADWLGIPSAATGFYPSLLGAVVIGIAIALLLEWKRQPGERVGLGLGGAVAIDLCAASVLAIRLLIGGLNVPLRGQVLLWSIVAVLVLVSGLGLVSLSKL